MKGKRNLIVLLILSLTVLLFACDNKNSHVILSLDEVSDLAQKGEELTWEDFEAYSFEDIGSGLHIRKYEIDDDYHVLVGGRSIDIDPMYIYLVKTNGEKIDIRYDDLNSFIS